MAAGGTIARIGAIAIPALIGLGVIGAIAWVRGTADDIEARLASQRETLARMEAATAQSRRALAAMPADARASLADDFLAGAQDSIVVAGLQNRLRDLAIANAVDLDSANTLPARSAGASTYLGLRLMLRGQLRDIQSVLHAIEAGTPLLFIERVALRVDSWSGRGSERRSSSPASS